MGQHAERGPELDGSWQLAALDGAPPVDGFPISVSFGDDGRVSGHAGVNRFGGPYRVDADVAELGAFFTTRMAGPPPAMEQEQRFLAALEGRHPVSSDGDDLIIGAIHLRRAPVEGASEREPAGLRTVTGHVTYRQRVALPPGALVRVQVRDVSLADSPSVTLAEQVIEATHQVPIPFSLVFDAESLDPRRTCAVSARITVDGQLAWISDTHHPVSTETDTEVDIVVVPVKPAAD